MTHPPVSIVRCGTYDQAAVDAAVAESIRLVGGMGRYVQPGQRVLIKVNLLSRKKPEEAVTTHPAVVEAVVKLVQAAGGRPVIGDSPAGPYTGHRMTQMYRVTGMEEVARRTGAALNDDFGEATRSFAGGALFKSFSLTRSVLDADVVIAMPKLKTHGLTAYTGAVKILFGCIPGMGKVEYHVRLPRLEDFAGMLVDLALCVRPALTVMDAVVGMDGPGPSAGRIRPVGLIIASPDPFALDVAAVSAVGHDPGRIPTIAAAGRRGLPARIEDVNILGAPLDEVRLHDFVLPGTGGIQSVQNRLPGPLNRAIRTAISPRPVFHHDLCTGCADCFTSCPPKAIEMRKVAADGRGDQKGAARPHVDLGRCIRCFCCQELCPQKAVEVHRPWLSRGLLRT
ncbi:MAG TPA: DUF362 domain-containing protein [Bacillota bacterium]|jgi:uncharacterized protein (DUF362 family)/Pyruvate/2-oxoacid:ferredoxin oxidoreductase delta subunit